MKKYIYILILGLVVIIATDATAADYIDEETGDSIIGIILDLIDLFIDFVVELFYIIADGVNDIRDK